MRGILAVLPCVALAVAFAAGIAGCKKSGSHSDIAGPPVHKVNAADLKQTVVTPHLEQPISDGKSVLWCSTFQLAWNELCALAGEDIHMQDEPPMVAVLNKKTATKDDLDEASYVALAGFGRDGIMGKIRVALNTRFSGKANPELLAHLPPVLPNDVVAYSYLFKELPFESAFVGFDKPLVFEGTKVASFGVDQSNDDGDNVKGTLARQVSRLDHKSNDDFIIELKTKNPADRLILAKVPPAATLKATVAAVRMRVAGSEPTPMSYHDPLQVPVLNFDVLKRYSELCGKQIASEHPEWKGTQILLALQAIRFRLDRNGAVLKSEAAIYVGEVEADVVPPAYVFDKPFLILLERKGAETPYFAMWVGNAELLVPFRK